MDKETLISIIKKYHLGGNVDNVLLQVKDKRLTSKFITTNKDAVGELNIPNVDIPDGDYGIYDTKNLLRLVKILDDEITITKPNKTKILLEDGKYQIKFPLTDFTPKVPNINIPEFDIEFEIEEEFAEQFVKAKKAMGNDYETFSMTHNKLTLEDSSEYSTKIEIQINPTKKTTKTFKLFFESQYFLHILDTNKDEKGKIELSSQGLLKITYPETTYYLIARN